MPFLLGAWRDGSAGALQWASGTALLAALGVLLLAAPDAVPGLTIPGSDGMPQMDQMEMGP